MGPGLGLVSISVFRVSEHSGGLAQKAEAKPRLRDGAAAPQRKFHTNVAISQQSFVGVACVVLLS